MKSVLFIFLLFSTIPFLAQEKAIELSKIGSEKTKIFKENKRVKIKTLEGGKYIGRIKIVGQKTIEIEGNVIHLNSISNIKSRSVIGGIVGTVLIITGAYFIGIAPIAAFFISSTSGSAFVIGGVVMSSSGIFFNEFAKNHRNTKWSYKIIDQ